jgi:AbrB family looped-hinge helix DNA binding protein
MATVATTRLSSKGQVVIPEEVRRRLNLKAGDRFLVTGEEDVVILKTLSPPRLQDFDRIIAEARRQARAAGLTQADITAAVARTRRRS